MNSTRVYCRFNKSTQAPGPFDARVEIVESATGLRYSWSDPSFQANDVLDLRLNSVKNPEDYSIRLMLDNNLAYAGRHQEDDLPF